MSVVGYNWFWLCGGGVFMWLVSPAHSVIYVSYNLTFLVLFVVFLRGCEGYGFVLVVCVCAVSV
jgi:hypothetical protein